MLFGQKNKFGIEVDPVQIVDEWVLGRFLFWIEGAAVGDPTDESVHLKGCIGWLEDFVENPRNRYEPDLFALPKEVVFHWLSVETSSDGDLVWALAEPYENRFSRFHVSHLGMSSFDQVTILLLESREDQQRCIWQQGESEIQEAFFSPGQLQVVATECIEWFATHVKVQDPV